MRRHRPNTLLLAIAVASAVWGGVAQADVAVAPLPLGTDGHGVRVVPRGRPARLAVLLSAKRYRTVAGHQVELDCSHVPRITLGGGTTTRALNGSAQAPRPSGSASALRRAPRRRGPIATRLMPRWDYCVLSVTRSDGPDSTLTTNLATIPLTQAGAEFADERRAALQVIGSVSVLQHPERHKLSVQRLARLTHAVILTSPAQIPPPGTLGLYTDGATHVYAARSDHAGTLLFLEKDGDVTRTNLLRYLENYSLLYGAGS
jgi:hypothetical protein